MRKSTQAARAPSSPLFPVPTARALVVGGGISGLTSAFRLRQRGFDVTVLESSAELGGKMSSFRRDGFTVNRAANILPRSYSALTSLIEAVGLGDQVGVAEPVLGIPRNGRLHRIRASGAAMLVDGVRTPLLSTRSKLLLRRLAADALRMRRSLSYADLSGAARFDVETVGGYCSRRLNEEIREYLVEPVLRALFTSNADDVSVVDFFFAAVHFVGAGLLRYPGGIDFLCRALAEHLDIRTGATVTRVDRHEDGATVEWRESAREHRERVDAVVIAVSGALVPGLYPGLDAVQREVLTERLRYCVSFAGHFALRTRPDESALIVPVPRSVDPALCVVTFDHNASPASVPEGRGLVSSYWLHEWGVTRAEASDEEIVEAMLAAMDKVVPGIDRDLLFANVDRWDPAVVRSYPGWYTEVGRFIARIDPAHRVQLAGDYLSASSTNACAVAAELAAGRLEEAVFHTRTVPVPAM